MVELTNANVQTVAVGNNVVFTETPVGCNRGYVVHREGSGVVTLRGCTNQCYARYLVGFGANLAVPTGGTAGAVSVAISVEGEGLNSATMTVTPAAVEEYFNVYGQVIVSVPRGCCVAVGVRNVGTQAVNVANPNFTVERIS